MQEDVVSIARQLIGKYLFTNFDNRITGGIITETEAYNGIVDKACHAFGNRRTKRTEIMYADGGRAYIYLCYGIHSLFNIVTNIRDVPQAVLIRAVYPTHGLEVILERLNRKKPTIDLMVGPGKLSKGLGLDYSHSGTELLGNTIWLEDQGIEIPASRLITGKRIGIDYAEEDAALPYRFYIAPLYYAEIKNPR